jgi:two-component system, cell cycle response regulator CtrA
VNVVPQIKSIAEVARANHFLRERIKQLEEMIGLRSELIDRLPIRGQAKVILSILHKAKGSTCSQKFIYDAIFGGRMIDVDLPDPKIVDVQICRLRKSLTPRGIEIGTARGCGWYLDEENRAKIDAWLQEIA